MDERLKLLQSFLVSKKEFQQASIKAKGNDFHVHIEDGSFCITQGRRRSHGPNMIMSCGDETYKLTPKAARELMKSKSDGKRKENNETKCDKQKTMKKRKSSDMHKSSDTAEREKHSKVVGKQKTDQRTSKDRGGVEPSSPSNARKLKESDGKRKENNETKCDKQKTTKKRNVVLSHHHLPM
ncbi:uncharacterized protein [Ptychodera flava]|uniref:uncharacterized protein n=1 Tax=Ptychodera flava TaxID=63121 RepID=UPI00396A95B3